MRYRECAYQTCNIGNALKQASKRVHSYTSHSPVVILGHVLIFMVARLRRATGRVRQLLQNRAKRASHSKIIILLTKGRKPVLQISKKRVILLFLYVLPCPWGVN